MQDTKTEKSFTHITTQRFNVLAPLSDHGSSILKLWMRDTRLSKNTTFVKEFDQLNEALSYSSVRVLTLLCNNTRSSTMSSDFRERLYVGSSSASSAGRLPEIHKTQTISITAYADLKVSAHKNWNLWNVNQYIKHTHTHNSLFLPLPLYELAASHDCLMPHQPPTPPDCLVPHQHQSPLTFCSLGLPATDHV